MARLTDPEQGFHRIQQLKDLGRHFPTQVKAIARDVFHLQQAINRLRGFRGLIAEEDEAHITPDHSERIKVHSPDGSVRAYSGPDGGSHDLALEVNPDALPLGCPDAFSVVRVGESDVIAASGCDTLEVVADCGIEASVDGGALRLSAPGIRHLTIGGVGCEEECYDVELVDDDCGVCWTWTEGEGGVCKLRARLKVTEAAAPGIGSEQTYIDLCDCEGRVYRVQASRLPAAPAP